MSDAESQTYLTPEAPRPGNTYSGRGAAAKHWICTIKYEGDSNDSTVLDFSAKQLIDKLTHIRAKYVFQLEEGESGYVHWQLYVCLPAKQRLSYLRSRINSTGHYECVKHVDQAKLYCSKAETRLYGPFMNISLPRDIESELRRELDLPLRPWQEQLKELLLNTEPDSRKVLVYVDEDGNTGKSWFVKHMAWKYPESGLVYITTTRSADILTAINQETRIVLIDIPRCVSNNDIFPANAIEQIKNGMITQGKLQKTMQFVLIPSVHIVVFTNHHPDRSKLSADRWQIINLRNMQPVPAASSNAHVIDVPIESPAADDCFDTSTPVCPLNMSDVSI